MLVLIGCEESQAVCKAFRELGHEAYSCDIQECSGGHPEWHIKGDVRDALKTRHWDLFICHPDCKYLCWSGERWMVGNIERQLLREQAFKFLVEMYDTPHADRVCIEQSLSLFLERTWKKPTQKVHPFHFGDPYRKTTSLWIKGLKPLVPDNITFIRRPLAHTTFHKDKATRSKMRAKTYPGIARAMAEQWGGNILTKPAQGVTLD